MIKKPTDKIESRKHIIMINGEPGIGKSTLALSAPDPLFIDCDFNIKKVAPTHRNCDILDASTYQELLDDLNPGNLDGYKTIIIDTGGALISMMIAYVIKQPKMSQRDGSLALKGYGMVKRMFQSFLDNLYYGMDKHIIIVNHVLERTENELTSIRPDVEGSSDRYMWKKAELAGLMYSQDGKRYISFAPTPTYYAKGAYGIDDVREIPYLKPGIENNFIGNLFDEIETYCEKEAEMIVQYQELMVAVKALIKDIKNPENANDVRAKFSCFHWIYASKREAAKLLNNRIEEIGCEYNSELGQIVAKA